LENMVKKTGFWADKKVLVTGASGFVGGNLAKVLVEGGAVVTIIDRDIKRNNPLEVFGVLNKINVVLGKVDDYSLVERLLSEYSVEVVFHLAAQPIVGVANRSPMSTFETNIRGTWNILEAGRLSKIIKAIVVASSDKAYGDQQKLPYTEDQPLLGIYPYDASKVCADTLTRCYAKSFNLPYAVTRFANIYGEGDFHLNRIVPGTIISLLKNETPVIRSNGTLRRDYLYVLDVANGYLTLARQVYGGNFWGEAFNFGTGKSVSVLDLFKLLIKASGRKVKPKILGEVTNEILDQSLDATKAEKLLGWCPKISLKEGLQKTFRWYKSHPDLVI
jgi:CDP-glucose 4,6-dehydratase